MYVQLLQQAHRVAGPSHRDCCDRKEVLEDQVPADEPGDTLPEGGVRVGVRAAGHRDHRGEFRVAKASKQATDAGEYERQRERGTCVLGGGHAGENEDAGTDDSADAQQRQLRGGECAPQLVAGVFLRLQLVDGLGGE